MAKANVDPALCERVTLFRGYKYRLQPTKAQSEALASIAGSVRWVWNQALERQHELHRAGEPLAKYSEMASWLVEWKRGEHPWLSDSIAQCLQQRLRDLALSISAHAANAKNAADFKLPPFQRKGGKTSFRLPQKIKVEGRDNGWTYLHIPKVGSCKIRLSRPLPSSPQNCTISLEGRHWYVAFQVDVTDIGRRVAAPDRALGIDLGVSVSAATSDGRLFVRPNEEKLCLQRLKRMQRELSRKQRTSANWKKKRARLRSMCIKLSRRRVDWTHKVTSEIASSSRHIAIEDLAVSNMMSRRKAPASSTPVTAKRGLNRAIWDQGWHRFRYQLTYKVQEAGGTLSVVHPAYTSQRCSSCGVINALSRRGQHFGCVACGYVDHADVNAAKNIGRAAGHAVSACGGIGHGAPVEAGTPGAGESAASESRHWGGRMPIRSRMCLTLAAMVAAYSLLSYPQSAAANPQRLPVENFRVLLANAIDSQSGAAHGILIGPMAEALTTRMKATSPILIDVTTVHRYKQAGCSRLNVRFSQEGVILPGTQKPQKQTFDLGLNYCRDGQPPKSLA
jgi:putative transposase